MPVKSLIVFLINKCIYYFVKLIPVQPKPNHLLLIKTDEIGDYILIRNLLHYFKQTGPYRQFSITLVANVINKQLLETYDQNMVDEVIWFNKHQFRFNFLYRFNVLKQIRKSAASHTINLVYSRNFRMDDVMAAVSTATEKMAMRNHSKPPSKLEQWLTPSIYTRLYEGGGETLFDAYRNSQFVEKLLQISIPNVSVQLDATENLDGFNLPTSYFVVFPGSRDEIRRWPINSFCKVAGHIVDRYGLTPVVCGSKGEKDYCDQFMQAFDKPVIDLVAKTNLPQFLTVLKQAVCIISVDTGAVHLAAAVQCPVFGIFSGRYYGRFGPYPAAIAPHFYALYPDQFEQQWANKEPIDLEEIPIDLLKLVQPEKVIAKIDTVMPGILSANKIN
jgi:ADP-heptose:LPS heptosyltransferase